MDFHKSLFLILFKRIECRFFNNQNIFPMKKVIFLASILAILSSCKPSAQDDAIKIAAAKQIMLDSINQANTIAQQNKTIDSLKTVAAKSRLSEKKTVVVQKSSPEPRVASVSKSKNKMNNTTKGALIGVGVGTVTGAILSKDKAKGAILGGVIGGSAGVGAGAIIDKKKEKN